MEQSPPPDPEIVSWLTTLGVTSLCQWDILIFLYQHHTTLLGVADLARLLGYASDVIVGSLDALEALGLVARSRVPQGVRLYRGRVLSVGSLDALEALDLVARSRVSQGVRLYRVCVLSDSPRGAAFARLYTLTADHAGRVRVARQLRRDHPPEESCPSCMP